MPPRQSEFSRRSILRRTGIAAGGLAVGTAAFAGEVAADEHDCDGCLDICWMDVKPSSCPNSVNPKSEGLLPVMAGWPRFDPSTVELIPVKADYDAAFDDCQDWTDPTYNVGSETEMELCQLAASSDRSASPISMVVEDVDDDGDLDSKFRFRVEDLELESDDTHLVLKGESATSDCTFYAIDSVRVLGGSTNETRGNTGTNGNKEGSDSTDQ